MTLFVQKMPKILFTNMADGKNPEPHGMPQKILIVGRNQLGHLGGTGFFPSILINSYFLQIKPRWYVDQIYVNQVKCELPIGVKSNKKNGCTLSVRKYGGWTSTYNLAKQIAGWTEVTA